MQTLNGYDYRTQQAVSRNTRAWKAEMAQVVAAGGFRRVENNETFVHAANGQIVFETYGYLPKVSP